MSRPRRHTIRPSQATPRSSTSSALPTVSGSTLKYSRKVRGFARRIGATSPATPFFIPTTTVSCWPASSTRVVAKSPWPVVDDSRQVSREPVSPSKQRVQRRPLAGAVTVALASLMGTAHWFPVTFQYSSSWSANPFSAPFTV